MSKRFKILTITSATVVILMISLVILYAAIKPVRAVSDTPGHVADMPIKPIQLNAGVIEALVNVERAKLSLPALAHNEQLTASACAKLDDMVAKDYWSHDDPSGTEPWHFFDEAGYKYRKSGENLAYAMEGDSQVVDGWMNSPGHRANIVNAFTDQGICTKTAQYQGSLNTVIVQHLGTR